MHVLLCNERFLFRFGVDRVLILLGQGLKKLGYHVSVMANYFDREIVEGFADQITPVPVDSDSYLNLNEFTNEWLKKSWSQVFKDTKPDIVIIGGWPFFSVIPFFNESGCKTVFIDCGAVPLDGYSDSALITQNKVRDLRRQFLKFSTLVTPISNFIAKTQSIVDAPHVPINPILLGADHMDRSIWTASQLDNSMNCYALEFIRDLKQKNCKLILNLGRWEPGFYKNSEIIYQLINEIIKETPNAIALILADPNDIKISPEFKNCIIPIGFPDDEALQEIMRQVDLGISVSLWEGFNLPLAEMQWLNRQVLVFNVGAHPEVILHSWYLCETLNEMAEKAVAILKGNDIPLEIRQQSFQNFQSKFRWKNFIQSYDQIFKKISYQSVDINIVIDVTNATKDSANSGVIRVTRRLCRQLQNYVKPVFVVWDSKLKAYIFPTEAEYRQLSQFNGPVISKDLPCSVNEKSFLSNYLKKLENNLTWLLLTETIYEVNGKLIRSYARKENISLAAIFYDAIPIIQPNLCKDIAIRENHANYMKGLSHCDLIIPISVFSGNCLKNFWSQEKLVGCSVEPNLLPGEFGGFPRNYQLGNLLINEIKILCVSTLEPRKNHYQLIYACQLLQVKYPKLNWSLILVGNRYAGGDDIVEFVQKSCDENTKIRWLGVVDDATLHELYDQCTFTVYPSVIEGFGMPIMESLWHGRPCICYEQGVMAEIASEGGCLTTNVTQEESLAEAIYRLATDHNLYEKLSREAVSRSIKTWDEYTQTFINMLKAHSHEPADNQLQMNVTPWQDILYPNCLCENWQMNESERLGLTSVLHRVKPCCAIEIGTYKGGSLSLISQYAEVVFSIDIDPSIPEKLKQFSNVSFFTGPSQLILPELLRELDRVKIAVDFMLIDGDHSTKGVKRDIEIMLTYVPKKPMFIMMHDGFNPKCREGMLAADWGKSPYVHWVDVDFIPGRVVEHGGGGHGEMWGGLALAYLHPIKRTQPFKVSASSKEIFERMKALQYPN